MTGSHGLKTSRTRPSCRPTTSDQSCATLVSIDCHAGTEKGESRSPYRLKGASEKRRSVEVGHVAAHLEVVPLVREEPSVGQVPHGVHL